MVQRLKLSMVAPPRHVRVKNAQDRAGVDAGADAFALLSVEVHGCLAEAVTWVLSVLVCAAEHEGPGKVDKRAFVANALANPSATAPAARMLLLRRSNLCNSNVSDEMAARWGPAQWHQPH